MTQAYQSLAVDIVVIGGGVAGLWLLARLRQAGYQAVLLESQALGAGQTRYAQGIIHGGTKYALLGKLTASSEAVSRMPSIWRACLQGTGELDLRSVKILSEFQYMWSTANLTSRLAGFFASQLMQSRTRTLSREQRPVLFQNTEFKGQVYRLEEPVLDTASIVHVLAEPQRAAMLHVDADSIEFAEDGTDQIVQCRSVDEQAWAIRASKVVLTAGKGNAGLLATAQRNLPEMQLRPLKMVMLRGGLPEALYAHCLDANVNPRITITSHFDSQGQLVWYLGGQLAEDGVKRTDSEQIECAKTELSRLMPWLDVSNSEWATLDIDRAEPRQADGKRPETSFVSSGNGIITAWPTKLALSPKLAADVLARLEQEKITPHSQSALPTWVVPPYAVLPWQEESRWKQDH